MKNKSNIIDAPKLNTNKQPITNSQKISKIIENINQNFQKQVSSGTIIVSPVSKIFPKQSKHHQASPQLQFQSIQQSLRALRSSIIDQKKALKQQQTNKLMQAQQLIDRMKKQRQQNHEKIKQKRQKIINQHIFSNTALNKMRQRLQQRIAEKRKELEERVHSIELRRNQRDEQLVNHQAEYWKQMKKLKHKSTSSIKLPQIATAQNKQIFRHQSLQKIGQIDKPVNHQQNSNKFLLIAQKQESGIKSNPQQVSSSRLEHIILNKNQQSILKKHFKIPEIISYSANKHKIMGNQFLKESLLLIRKSRISVPSEELSDNQGNHFELQAREVKLNKNEKIEKLKQKWERMLSKIKHNQIPAEQGYQILAGIQKKLDKMDFSGVKERLKIKYETMPSNSYLSESISNHIQASSLQNI